MIVDSPLELSMDDLFIRLKDLLGVGDVFLKVEGLNVAGSIKLKPARAMIDELERRGRISPDKHRIIESSSGSLGVALSLVCRVRGYRFTCVTDPNVCPTSEKLMRAYGSEVVIVTDRDECGGYLGSRLAYIERRLASDTTCFWPNQYANRANVWAHYRGTAREIHKQFPEPDFVFIGAGTTGTLVGCARYFAFHCPRTRVVAVDAVGSVTFGHPAGPRQIPGLGTSRRPEITSTFNVSDIVMVPEWRAVEVCRAVQERYGFLVGGSTGSVLAAIDEYRDHLPAGSTVVAVSPDFGDRYVSTIYDPAWVAELLAPAASAQTSAGAHAHLADAGLGAWDGSMIRLAGA